MYSITHNIPARKIIGIKPFVEELMELNISVNLLLGNSSFNKFLMK
jgi:hypothetical protein